MIFLESRQVGFRGETPPVPIYLDPEAGRQVVATELAK
jgi:hypothetical protein